MTWQGNPRTTALLAVAKANNLKLDMEHTEPAKGVSDDYRKLNKLGKVPTFEGSDGYILSECIAIAIYRKTHPTATFSELRKACNKQGPAQSPCPDEHHTLSFTVIPV